MAKSRNMAPVLCGQPPVKNIVSLSLKVNYLTIKH